MQIVYSRCCGLDVHKKSVTACVLVLDQEGHRSVRKKQFETHRPGLHRLVLWLYASKVTQVAMERFDTSAAFRHNRLPYGRGSETKAVFTIYRARATARSSAR